MVLDVDTIGAALDTVVADQPRENTSSGEVPPRMSLPGVSQAQKRALRAKLSLPHQGFILSRPRLLRRIERLRAGGVVSLVAGPGYGKTAFIVDLLSSLNARPIYFSLDEGDRDPVRFVEYLMAGLGVQAGPAKGDQTRAPGSSSAEWTVASGADGDTSAASLATLMDIISSQADCSTILAIDDVHLVDSSSEVMQVLEVILQSLPPGWTVLLSSRRRPSLSFDDVGLGGRLIRLQGRDLRLTPREVSAWANRNWAVVLQPSEARALWRLTEGWPAALVLLGQHLLSQQTRIERSDVISIMARGSELRAYLERHVISDLDAFAAQTILTGSLLPRVVFPRDDPFLPGGPGEAEALLEEFVSRGFLVTRTGQRSFTIHPLLRGFATRELWSREEETQALRRAAEHLEQNDEDREAAYLYLRAGYLKEAVRPLRSLAVSSLNAVLDFARDEWLDLIPEEMIGDQPWLLVAKAKTLQQRASYGEAAALYERAARLLSGLGDKQGLLSVLLSLAFCLFNQGLWEESLAILVRCRSLAGSAGEKVEVLVSEGSVLVSLCRWDEAVENWEKALALAPEHMRSSLAPRIHLHRARLFYSLGHYCVAKQWMRKSLVSCSERASPAYALALNGMALLEFVTAGYEAAERHVRECMRLVRARGYSFLHISALLTLGGLALAEGDFRAGLVHLREAQRMAVKAGDAEDLFWACDMLGDLCRRQKNARKALEHHREALDVVNESRLSLFERVRAATSIGIDLVVLGDETQGRASLEEAVEKSRRWKLDGSLVPALFYLGWVYARSGQEREATRALAETMKLAAEHDQVHFFVQEARLAVPVLALCDRHGSGEFVREQVVPLLPARLQSYFRSLAEGSTYPTDVALGLPRAGSIACAPVGETAEEMESYGAQGIESLTDRERDVLKLIALGMSNKVIGSKLFITEKTVKTHANHVFRKLGVSSRLQATLAFQSYQRTRRRSQGAR